MILQVETDTLKWSQLVFIISFKTGAGGLFTDGLCWLYKRLWKMPAFNELHH